MRGLQVLTQPTPFFFLSIDLLKEGVGEKIINLCETQYDKGLWGHSFLDY